MDILIARGRRFFVTTLIESSIYAIRTQRPSIDAYVTIGISRQGLGRWEVISLRLSEIFPMWRIARCRANGIAIHFRLASPWVRWWCRRHSLAIVVWTVDKPAFVESWLGRDVDVVTTNRPLFALRRREALFGPVSAEAPPQA